MKNNKKILLMIMTLLVSIILFTNKANAIVMWMQCTDSAEDEVATNHKDFRYYNTYALINNKLNTSFRHLVYNPNGFYTGKKPVYILYNYNGANKNGQDVGNICWYRDVFDEMQYCDINYDSLIDITELLNGSCPTTVYQTKGWETSGPVKGDFVVLAGKKKANQGNIENLNEAQFVIYGFKDENDKEGIMIEGYNSSGLYGYATTWEDWNSFVTKLRMSPGIFGQDGNDVISENNYNTEYMSWTAMTQARRINKFGRNYFKLLDSSRPWIVGAVDNQKFTVTETVDGKNIMYRSDDSNNKFYNWVSTWYEKYEKELSKQIKAVENLKSQKYQKANNVAKEISESLDNGKKYNFGEDYSPSQMVLDLNDAYNELTILLSNNESMYDYYDEKCNLAAGNKTSDALAAITTQFNCEIFNTSSINKFPHKTNATMLNQLIVDSLNTALNKYTESEVSIAEIQSTAKEYITSYTTAIKYIQKNEVLTGEAEELIKKLEENYIEMARKFEVEIIIDCEDLIGEELRAKIASYLNIVKIAVPILLIVYGIIDFTKATFSADEDKMKKAQKDFLLRLGISVLFFLTPTIVNLLLGLANKVWNFIEPGSCGIFN